MRYLIALLLMASAASAQQRVAYSKKVNPVKLARELKAATGYNFMRECDTCTVQGWITTHEQRVGIGLYTKRDPGAPWISTATVTTALTTKVSATLAAHVPTVAP